MQSHRQPQDRSCADTGKHLHSLNPLQPSCFLPVQVGKTELTSEALNSIRTATGYQGNSLSRVRVSAAKPNFEVGSSSQIKLSFGKNTVKPGMFISPLLCLLRFKVHFILNV